MKKSNILYSALFIYLVAASFVNQDIYAFTVRYDSLLIFIVLFILVLPHLKEDIKNKDADLIMAFATAALSVLFVLITRSGYGAALIPSDLALICYASKRLKLTDNSVLCLSFAGACPVILWYSHVRWSYNFNMAGFAFMLMAYFGMILVEEAGDRCEIKYRGFIKAVIFITAFILSMLYHSRTAMFGMAVFFIVYMLYGVISANKWLYRILFILATVGAVAFTAVYIMLASNAGNITLLYKDVFSGREAIWRELWGALLNSPVTGIGSAYELKSFEIFEVHDGMFDILTVHGIPVFALVTVLMYRMFERVRHHIAKPHTASGSTTQATGLPKACQTYRIALSAAFSMMFTSYFENYFTVPPYSIFFMTFILIAGEPRDNGGAAKGFD